jgi:dolichol kinase
MQFSSHPMFSEGDLIGLAGVYIYVGIIVILASKLKFVRNAKVHRKFVHIMVGNIVFIWWVFDSNYVMAFLAAAPFIPLLLLASPYSHFSKMKDSFLGKTTEESHDLGLVYYAISWTILAFFFFDLRLIASIAIVSMAYGDGMGGLIGKRFGKHRIHGPKTLEGTLAVFFATLLASAVVILFYQWLDVQGLMETNLPLLGLGMVLAYALIVAAFVAVVELLTPGAFDNLVIPLGTALLLYLIWAVPSGYIYPSPFMAMPGVVG